MKVGFIGLGHMGAGMASTLLNAHHEVTVYNRTREKALQLVALGAQEAATVSGACRGDVVTTMLTNDSAVENVVFGRGGILEMLRPGALHISSSTISVALAERLSTEHAKHGQRFVSAPVFGRPEWAAAGKLFVIAAGMPAAIKAATPLLDALGEKVFFVSQSPKAANVVKLAGNFLTASVLEALGEAFALAGKGGVDPQHFLGIMTSSMFDAPPYKTYGARILGRDFEPGFAASLAEKDIRLALAAAEDLRVPMPLASLLRDRFLNLMAHGAEGLDWTAIGRLANVEAGGEW